MKYIQRITALLTVIALSFSLCIQGAYATNDTVSESSSSPTSEVTDTSEETNVVQPDDMDEPIRSVMINYAVINSPELSTPDTQKILIGIGDESTTIDQAELVVRNQQTGALTTYDANELTAGAALFCMDYTAGQSGTYELYSIRYVYATTEIEVLFSDLEIQAVFGVDTETDSEPDAVVVDESADSSDTSESTGADVVFDVTTLDNGGDATLSNSVEQALNDAAVDISGSGDYGISTQAMDAMTSVATQSSGRTVVVLDPGHGTWTSIKSDLDHGASSQYNGVTYYESDLTLKIAKYCKAELEKYANVDVYLTREGDVNSVVTIKDRVNIAKNYGATVLVSIHLNSSEINTAHGAEVYYSNSNGKNGFVSAEGKELSAQILKQLTALGLTSHSNGLITKDATKDKFEDGSAQDYYGINRYSKEYGFPGIIVEHAFLSNASDFANYLSSDAKLKKLGVADATGIANYLGLSKSSSTVVTASTVYNGVDYAPVYDYQYYVEHNPDVVKQYGSDPQTMLWHFVTYGMDERLQASANFDVNSYRYRYADLRALYHRDWKAYYLHYINTGIHENRVGIGTTKMQNPTTVFNGKDYSAVYDYDYYVAHNPDVVEVFSDDDWQVLWHFVIYGMSEGRQGSTKFDVNSYRYQYYDLRPYFRRDLKAYYLHYINSGIREKRVGTGTTKMQNPTTIFNGVDYSAVYDYYYYVANNPDVVKVFGDDDWQVLWHFVIYGMSEGRQGSANFDMNSYRYRYADLRALYHRDWKAYYLHYINTGIHENRVGTGTTKMQNPTTVFNGKDYSAVYDYDYYVAHNPDVVEVFSDDDWQVLWHFVIYGMSEGRQGSTKFDVNSYRYQYYDLRPYFRRDWKAYYLHYINSGIREKRVGTGTTKMQNPTTIFNGVDYSAVYDYDYYVAHNPDVVKVFSDDDWQVLWHFVIYGMSEGRQAKADFNVDYYKANYSGLRAQYGTNNKSYYMHYIQQGKAAGMIADRSLDVGDNHVIMSVSTTTADQMVRLFQSRNKNFNEAPYQMTLKQFCQLYVDECNAEGVDAAVAFCQAMTETGWLQYGGDCLPEYFNFAGINTSDSTNGTTFQKFSTVQEGIRAHVQHLKAYASTESLKNPCVDPRFQLVKRGNCPYVEWLGAQENPNHTGWASSAGYGSNIVKLINALYNA